MVAVGLESGRIILHNLRYDETVTELQQDWGAVTSLSFRSDGHPILCSGSVIGHIAQWNLEERKLQSQIRDAHAASVTGERLPNLHPVRSSLKVLHTIRLLQACSVYPMNHSW